MPEIVNKTVDAMVNINGLIMLVIFIMILTALAPTVIENTETGAGTSLENASAGSKSMYSIIELLYPVMAIFGVLAVIGITKGRQ